MFKPVFQLTPAMTRSLMAIEADRQAVMELPIDVAMLASLRETARLLSTHHSTQIEGNRLTEAQVQEVLTGSRFPGRERDEAEVRNYYAALEAAERLAASRKPLTETELKRARWQGIGNAVPRRAERDPRQRDKADRVPAAGSQGRAEPDEGPVRLDRT